MEFRIFNLGLVDFKKAWQFQKEIFKEVKNNYFNAALILCRHYPVVTLGRQARPKNIKVLPLELKNKGLHLYEIERGGDVTYHGPGQLIAYHVFNLNYLKKDIHLFLRQLEGLAIDFLSDFGIRGSRCKGLTGVWIDKKKVASIGIAIRNWITFHGMSINIKKFDLENFSLIRPCGMDIEMTSLETILGEDIQIEHLNELFIRKFKDTFFIPHYKEVSFI